MYFRTGVTWSGMQGKRYKKRRKKMKRKGLFLAVLFILAISLVYAGGRGQIQQKELRFAYVVKNLTNPYFVEQARGVQEACDRLGIKVEIQATTADTEIDRQIQFIENFIVTRPDVIICTPLNSTAVIPAIKQANDAGIIFVNSDGMIDESELQKLGATVLTTVMGDNRKAGQEAARAFIKYFNNSGDVAVLEGTSGVATAEERKRGFEEIMASEGTGIRIVASQPANYNRNMGYQITQTILVAHPEIKGIFGANDELALGAMRAVEEAGRNDIAIVGINYGAEAQQAMVEGKMLGSISQSPYDMGRIAVEVAYDYITKNIKPEYMILTPTQMMYKEDVKL